MLQFSNITIETAPSNQNGTMEADTISKNKRSLKSQMSRSNKCLPLLVICLFAITNCSLALAQKKMYIWPPNSQKYVQSNMLKGTSVNVEIKDARVIAPDSKVKASFEQISNVLLAALTQTYGKSFINKSNDQKIEIILDAYDATFYSGMWHAQTRYIVRIGEKEETIEQTNNQFNVGGNSSGKKVLTKSFVGANMKLFQFLNENLK